MTDRDRKTIRLGGIALAILLLVWFLVLPWWQSWGETREHIDRSLAQLDEMQDRTHRVISLDRQLEPVLGAAYKQPLHGVAMMRRELIKSVSELYQNCGAEIQSVQPQADRVINELPGVTRLSVQVQSACAPMQLVQLLSTAKSSSNLLLLDKVEMTSGGMRGGGALNITMVWSTLATQNGGGDE